MGLDAKEIGQIALAKVAEEVIKGLPDDQIGKLVADGLSIKLGEYTRDYAVKNAVEDAIKRKVVELLASDEFQKKLEERAREVIEEDLLELFQKAVLKTFWLAFAESNDSYKNSKFAQVLEKMITERGQTCPPTTGTNA